MQLQPGSVFAGYFIESLLGSGGMGEVYLVTNPTLSRREAMKVLSTPGSDTANFGERFVAEARTAARLTHPNLVTILQYGIEDGAPWFTMEYLPGRDLTAAALPPAELASAVHQIADALDYAHASGVVHRDIKPANIIINRDHQNRVRATVLDFGIARLQTDPSLTESNVFVGTAAFTAPEIVRNEAATPETDQYSLACTVYAALTGRPPFTGNSLHAILNGHINLVPPPVREFRPDLTAVDEVLSRALAKTPEQRYRSCLEFAEALGTALQRGNFNPIPAPTLGLQQPQTLVPPAYPQPTHNNFDGTTVKAPLTKRRRRRWLSAGIAVALAATVGGTAPLWWPSTSTAQAPSSVGAQIASAYGVYCAIQNDEAYCWGDNTHGQLGNGTIGYSSTPVKVAGLSNVTSIAVGGTEFDSADSATTRANVCATADGKAYCWGQDFGGLFGSTDDYEERSTPAAIADLNSATAITTDQHTACAIDSGFVYCWGRTLSGQGGVNATDIEKPTKVDGLSDAVQIVTQNDTTCAVTKSGKLYCWGDNSNGQLTLDTESVRSRATPVFIESLSEVSSVSIGSGLATVNEAGDIGRFTEVCATADRKLYCWGGYPTIDPVGVSLRSEPVLIEQSPPADFVTTDVHTRCVISDNQPFCWGNNRYGQLGNGTVDFNSFSAQVPGIDNVQHLSTRMSSTCALTMQKLYCWGDAPWLSGPPAEKVEDTWMLKVPTAISLPG